MSQGTEDEPSMMETSHNDETLLEYSRQDLTMDVSQIEPLNDTLSQTMDESVAMDTSRHEHEPEPKPEHAHGEQQDSAAAEASHQIQAAASEDPASAVAAVAVAPSAEPGAGPLLAPIPKLVIKKKPKPDGEKDKGDADAKPPVKKKAKPADGTPKAGGEGSEGVVKKKKKKLSGDSSTAAAAASASSTGTATATGSEAAAGSTPAPGDRKIKKAMSAATFFAHEKFREKKKAGTVQEGETHHAHLADYEKLTEEQKQPYLVKEKADKERYERDKAEVLAARAAAKAAVRAQSTTPVPQAAPLPPPPVVDDGKDDLKTVGKERKTASAMERGEVIVPGESCVATGDVVFRIHCQRMYRW